MPKKAAAKRKRGSTPKRQSKRLRASDHAQAGLAADRLSNESVAIQESSHQDDGLAQDTEHTTVLNIDTSHLQESVTASVVSAISEHIRVAVRTEVERLFPAIIQSSTGRPGPEVSTASEPHIGRPAAASTWTPQNQERGIVNAGPGQGPDPGASSSTAASSPQVGESPSFGLGPNLDASLQDIIATITGESLGIGGLFHLPHQCR